MGALLFITYTLVSAVASCQPTRAGLRACHGSLAPVQLVSKE